MEPNMEVVKVEFTQDELMWVAEAAATVEENMMRIRRERIEDGTWGEEDRAALFTLIQANEKLIRAMG